ncbi:hypothetical protein [Methylobacterium sp. J-068]|uniref:hypothetical protein n=1 Tax=Methylobacterium sp. J-068 TaxID=2836649 RepID=UPI001FB9E1D8|nr:hypothetical protein [Methylobacterium sp. J-068]MCJ2035589.1 hypothetical protein [Methylobacterium sp. J-068]
MTQMMTVFPTPGTPLPSPIESASAQAAAGRRGEAQRKREERAERKAQGLPDPRVVDTAIVSALATVLVKGNAAARIQAKGGDMSIFRLPLETLMAEAMLTLTQGRHIDRKTAGKVLAQRLRIV